MSVSVSVSVCERCPALRAAASFHYYHCVVELTWLKQVGIILNPEVTLCGKWGCNNINIYVYIYIYIYIYIIYYIYIYNYKPSNQKIN